MTLSPVSVQLNEEIRFTFDSVKVEQEQKSPPRWYSLSNFFLDDDLGTEADEMGLNAGGADLRSR